MCSVPSQTVGRSLGANKRKPYIPIGTHRGNRTGDMLSSWTLCFGSTHVAEEQMLGSDHLPCKDSVIDSDTAVLTYGRVGKASWRKQQLTAVVGIQVYVTNEAGQ